MRTFPGSVRTAVRDPRSMVDGAAVTPIAVLFGHTFLDAFDRGGFNIILPEVQKAFDLDLAGITGLASVSIVAGIVLSLPVSLHSDRSGRRTLYLALGAFVAAFFSLTAGVAATIGLFGVSRAGFGFGLIVNDPVQQSLLSDYTPVKARPSVFAGRQIADNFGGLMGPLVFGLLSWAIGWRSPLILVAVMAVVLGVLSLRLREPSKGGMERVAMGATGADIDAEEEPAGFREAYRILKVIPTVRTMWFSLPFLFGGVLGLLIVVPLFLEEVFGLDAAQRGLARRVPRRLRDLRPLPRHRPHQALPVLRQAAADVPADGRHLGRDRARRLLPRRRAEPGPDDRRRHVPRDAVLAGAPRLRHPVLDHHAGEGAHGRLRHHPALGPPRARGHLPFVGAVGDAHGLRWGLVVSLPVFLVGSVIIGSGGRSFQSDMAAAHEASMAAIRQRNEA